MVDRVSGKSKRNRPALIKFPLVAIRYGLPLEGVSVSCVDGTALSLDNTQIDLPLA